MSDLIDRQAAVDTVRELLKKNTTVAIRVMYEIERLPSAQPEKSTEKRTETHACDLISRQAAIDAVNKREWLTEGAKEILAEVIEQLPSAQPERPKGEWIEKSTNGKTVSICPTCGYIEWDTPRNFCPVCGADMRGE